MSANLPYSVVVSNKATIGGTLAGGTTGSVLFINPDNTIAQDNANFFYDDTNERLGLGTTNPLYKLNSVGNIAVSRFGTGLTPVFIGQSAGGTEAAPTAVASNTALVTFAGRGYDGSAFTPSSVVYVQGRTTENWASGATGTELIFATCKNLTSTRVEQMVLTNDGNLGIGTITPNANAILDVTSTTKAFMPPRMTTAQKNLIASPTAGMVVYDSSLAGLSLYTTSWEAITPYTPVIFFGALAAVQALPNFVETTLINLTQDLINVGSAFNSTTGRFTAPTTGVYNLFCAVLMYFGLGNDGIYSVANLNIYNAANVIQRQFTSQIYIPASPIISSFTSSLNVNYTLTAGWYVVVTANCQDTTLDTNAQATSTFFGGSKMS